MTRRRALLRWLADWRNGATLLATVVVAVLVVSYVEAVRGRAQALDAATATAEQAVDARQAATRRIDALSRQLDELNRRASADSAVAAAQRAQLYEQLVAVIAQLRQLGVEPVVTPGPEPTYSARPRSSPRPSTTASPTSRPTRSPSPTASPSPTCIRLPIVGCPVGRTRP